MTPEYINNSALTFLHRQEWEEAQKLFYLNARKNPSHQTYNNLGYYLITEGVFCKDKKIRNALKIGIKYLKKASELGTTSTNLAAQVKAIEYQLRTCKKRDETIFHKRICDLISTVEKSERSKELQYIFLRSLYLSELYSTEILTESENLVKDFTCTESVSLYFATIDSYGSVNNGLKCIKEYGDFLDEIDQMIFYSKNGFPHESHKLCQSILNNYFIDEFIIASAVDNLFNIFAKDEAMEYAKEIRSKAPDLPDRFINKLLISNDYRRSIIGSYKFIPPPINVCCYFGCPLHATAW